MTSYLRCHDSSFLHCNREHKELSDFQSALMFASRAVDSGLPEDATSGQEVKAALDEKIHE